MKKVLVSFICIMLLALTGCKKSASNNSVDAITKYMSSLNSYEIKGDMTVYRDSKNINIEVAVCYLNPSYYKVSFNNKNGNEQLIVKNDEGVFVLTPSLNKEFKFDSEWPLNSSNAYLLSALAGDIKADQQATITLDGDIAEISSKLTNKNNMATKLKLYFNVKTNTPVKAILLDNDNKEKVLMEFKEFTPNKSLTKEIFNTKAIMDEKKSVNESTENPTVEEEASIAIAAGYVCDGAQLQTNIANDDLTILCYTGDINYTIVVNKAESFTSSVAIEEYTDFDWLESGLLLIGDNISKFFIGEAEVSIYSNEISYEEVLAIASDIAII